MLSKSSGVSTKLTLKLSLIDKKAIKELPDLIKEVHLIK
jgi:hypothetical protein